MTKDKKNNLSEVSEERGSSIISSSFFAKLLKKATRFLGTPGRVYSLVADSYAKSDGIINVGSITTKLKIQIFGLFDLVVDFIKGNYRDVDTKSIVLVIAGMIYLVSPLDLIPDFIPVIGLLDDISVLSFIISKLSTEIDTYLLWRNHSIKKSKITTKKKLKPTVIEIEKVDDEVI